MRKLLAVVIALIAWIAIVSILGLILRVSWPAYASVAAAMTFSLPMMLARLAISAVATLSAGAVAARIQPRSALVTLVPGAILLVLFIPQHVLLWPKFPIWYHVSFLLSLVPLTWAGGAVVTSRAAR